MSDFSRLLENERYEIGGDEAGTIPGEMEAICSFSLLPLLPCKLWALALPCVAWSICWRAKDQTTLPLPPPSPCCRSRRGKKFSCTTSSTVPIRKSARGTDGHAAPQGGIQLALQQLREELG